MSAEAPQREVAYRLFAAEFSDAEYTYAESDEERAPNYVVTPTGARVNRVFVVGVLTEVERVSDEVLRARIVDPTGAFVVYAGQYQPEALSFFERADPPAFVAVTGKARTFQPEDSEVIYTSIRPESANVVTAETRDRWVVQTAEQTLDRVETFAGALALAERGDALVDALSRRGVRSGLAAGIPRAIEQYGTTTAYLAEIRRVALDAARVVADELEEVTPPTLAPDADADHDYEFDASLPEPDDATADASPDVTADEMPGDDSERSAAATSESVETSTEPGETSTEAAATETGPSQETDPVDAESGTAETETETTPTDAASEDGSDAEPVPDTDVAETSGDAATGSGPDTERDAGEPDSSAPADVAPGEDAGEPTDTPVDPDEMYEMSEEERAEVESEFGVGFETGNEVQDPGEGDIDTDTPEPEAATDAEGSPPSETESDSEPTETSADAADVDLEDVVVETMGELDDGDGAPRDELVTAVADEYDVPAADVEDAIQDALMGGRCYEPTEDRITPI
ncbi:hypothetical protein [Halanaeroarchaeum sulfurireducens]|uniref:Glycerol dehydrogenase n=1 Tax=Halanaeroarchaeum sulfurireducens TaxID=1604004 RepID=A0A0F7PEV3_9EURY|nr:hypothetical protein [Halanaeroarchaeum sulfurireducens]AKH98129.1 glycerol dehydrogenase [Halanaeroarchaeum sulfurireducens]ALG82523.1 glycerol dehydrogenase [Halanaeroarchaeum sulfurireducens]